jgi:DNA-binding response OmpR family regulator
MQTIDKKTKAVFRPASDGTIPFLPQPPQVEVRPLKIRLLVVDDEQSICDLLQLYFGIKGLQVTTVRKVAEARTLIDRGEFDLLVLEWKLEGADGLDLLDLSKTKHPGVPVLIFTSTDDGEDLLKKTFAGRADAVVRKLGSFDALAAEVFAHLDRPDRDGERRACG